ncbi:MAG: nuclear transport factor 2 family protein [Myxococcota bacterium]
MPSQFEVETKGYAPPLQAWIDWILSGHDAEGLHAQLDDNVTFMSPVVFTPQKGAYITFAYLMAASEALGGNAGVFKYVRIFDCGQRAVLEFETEINGKYVNGVDMIEWSDEGKIVDFKVMVRPLQAVQAVHASMGAVLQKMQSAAKEG